MKREIMLQMRQHASTPDALACTQNYLADHLRTHVKKGDKVLLCFRSYEEDSLGGLFAKSVMQCDAVPVRWGPDYRWKTLLQTAFVNRVTTIIAPPLVVLGLAKLIKHNRTPLYIRHVVTAGYPCLDWMIDGIAQGLDCTCSGCFVLGDSPLVAGYSCNHSDGIHLRGDQYSVDIVDEKGNIVSPGQRGEMVLFLKATPHLRYPMGEFARYVSNPCTCGTQSHRLKDMFPGNADMDLVNLGQQLHSWTSILDCRLSKGDCGLEIELVVFPGEKLPKLPTAAKQVIRPWDPSADIPMFYMPAEKTSGFFSEYY